MPWCHQCNSEYREGIEKCVDCQVSLHPEPPAPPPTVDEDELLHGGEELVILARADLGNAAGMKAALEEHVIVSLLVREPAETPEAELHPVFHVVVAKSRVDDSVAVLQKSWDALLALEGLGGTTTLEEGADEAPPCPACGFALGADAPECPDCGLVVG